MGLDDKLPVKPSSGNGSDGGNTKVDDGDSKKSNSDSSSSSKSNGNGNNGVLKRSTGVNANVGQTASPLASVSAASSYTPVSNAVADSVSDESDDQDDSKDSPSDSSDNAKSYEINKVENDINYNNLIYAALVLIVGVIAGIAYVKRNKNE